MTGRRKVTRELSSESESQLQSFCAADMYVSFHISSNK